jgi:hypothetical protein
MKKFSIFILIFYIFTGCNSTQNTKATPIENNEEVAPSLSVEEVEALMQASNPNEKIYKGTLSFGSIKNIEFTCDSGKLFSVMLELPNDGFEMNTYKKTKVTRFVDVNKTMDFQDFILISSAPSFSEKCKKTTTYKVEIKLLSTIMDSSFVAPYTLKTTVE